MGCIILGFVWIGMASFFGHAEQVAFWGMLVIGNVYLAAGMTQR
jgi:hypothetical protein